MDPAIRRRWRRSRGQQMRALAWRVVRIVFLLIAGAVPGMPPPPPPPPHPTEQIADGVPDEEPP